MLYVDLYSTVFPRSFIHKRYTSSGNINQTEIYLEFVYNQSKQFSVCSSFGGI